MSLPLPKWFLGEVIGTFLLVFFGCGSVATAVALGAPVGVFQVAATWGLGLAAAIYLTAGLSGAHLNPAITLAFAAWSDFPWRRVGPYMAAQLLGAFLAAAAVYGVFSGAISGFESSAGLERGAAGSEASAMIFGEYFPNPGGEPLVDAVRAQVSPGRAFFAECLGTALLAFAIFGFTAKANASAPGHHTPLAIGLTLLVLICIFGPVTMAGFNPARDFAPRLFSVLAGWRSVPFTANGIGWLTVYIVAPCLGAWAGAGLTILLFGPRRAPAATAELTPGRISAE